MKTRLFIFTVILIFISTLTFLAASRQDETTRPSPQSKLAPRTKSVSPLQKTTVGKTSEKELERELAVDTINERPDGSKIYTISSENFIRKNEVVTKNSTVALEKIRVDTDPNSASYTTFSQVKKTYGEPESSITGSIYYGNFVITYIYAKKGLAVVVHQYTKVVYEIQTFKPTTVAMYIQQYGDDLVVGENQEQGY